MTTETENRVPLFVSPPFGRHSLQFSRTRAHESVYFVTKLQFMLIPKLIYIQINCNWLEASCERSISVFFTIITKIMADTRISLFMIEVFYYYVTIIMIIHSEIITSNYFQIMKLVHLKDTYIMYNYIKLIRKKN